MAPAAPVLFEGALEQQRVDERLRQVSPQLTLGDVELLGEQAGGPAGRPVAARRTGPQSNDDDGR
jgi:hypothetical protein